MSASNCVIPVPPTLPVAFRNASYSCRYPSQATTKSPVECQWATKYPEMQKACTLAQICTHSRPRHVRVKQGIRSVIQEGPTCGLTALAMVAADGAPTVADILQVARTKGYTNHGEMFSARNLLQLTEHVFKLVGKDYVSLEQHTGPVNCDAVREALVDGACLMVAYPFFLFYFWKCTLFKTFVLMTHDSCMGETVVGTDDLALSCLV